MSVSFAIGAAAVAAALAALLLRRPHKRRRKDGGDWDFDWGDGDCGGDGGD